ncbi:DNA-binding transcriptional regulator [Mangrovactinospora gilvigrisea]|uniref:DNA-binding transcriptional regulator n=1 Tax=Mangrovactinospora gilvigrisea TaxID=1428644 RepID=A0A1J7BXY9_9ACTN|nr:substrate-binding domain-containing protein [Mangrovactinospora gilvigrisea]OIV38361.1 DNA-binding transcriptional regulator [Mangrovactinospora gilvigrisea]
MRPKVGERQDRLLDVVREAGSIRVAQLAEKLGVSQVTVRRDVEALAARRMLDRAHGAVSWPSGASVPAARPSGEAAAAAGEPRLVLGMVVPNAAYYFAEIIKGAREAAAEAGVRLVLGFSGYRERQDAVQVERLLGGGVHGMLLAPGWLAAREDAARADWVAELDVPTVLVERRGLPGSPVETLDRVCTDHGYGVQLALRHLTELGHRRIVLAARDDSPTALAVRTGWTENCPRLGVTQGGPILTTQPAEADPQAFEKVLDAVEKAISDGGTTALLVHNDVSAIELMQGLDARGIRVPDDLALVAYDDEVAALADTPLTAVAPPKRMVGRAAVEILVQQARAAAVGEEWPRRHLDLLPRLNVRESCRG